MKSLFSLKGKNHGTNSEYFYYYQIYYNNSCVCLTVKEKNLSYFSLFSHTQIIFVKCGNTLLSPPWLFSWKRQYLTLSFLLRSSQAKISFLSLGFMLYFLSPHRENPWAKAIKFFLALSIYKTLLLFSFGLGIHYLFNKESILSWIRNILPF